MKSKLLLKISIFLGLLYTPSSVIAGLEDDIAQNPKGPGAPPASSERRTSMAEQPEDFELVDNPEGEEPQGNADDSSAPGDPLNDAFVIVQDADDSPATPHATLLGEAQPAAASQTLATPRTRPQPLKPHVDTPRPKGYTPNERTPHKNIRSASAAVAATGAVAAAASDEGEERTPRAERPSPHQRLAAVVRHMSTGDLSATLMTALTPTQENLRRLLAQMQGARYPSPRHQLTPYSTPTQAPPSARDRAKSALNFGRYNGRIPGPSFTGFSSNPFSRTPLPPRSGLFSMATASGADPMALTPLAPNSQRRRFRTSPPIAPLAIEAPSIPDGSAVNPVTPPQGPGQKDDKEKRQDTPRPPEKK